MVAGASATRQRKSFFAGVGCGKSTTRAPAKPTASAAACHGRAKERINTGWRGSLRDSPAEAARLESLAAGGAVGVDLQAGGGAGAEAPAEGGEEPREALGRGLAVAAGLEEPLAGGHAQLRGRAGREEGVARGSRAYWGGGGRKACPVVAVEREAWRAGAGALAAASKALARKGSPCPRSLSIRSHSPPRRAMSCASPEGPGAGSRSGRPVETFACAACWAREAPHQHRRGDVQPLDKSCAGPAHLRGCPQGRVLSFCEGQGGSDVAAAWSKRRSHRCRTHRSGPNRSRRQGQRAMHRRRCRQRPGQQERRPLRRVPRGRRRPQQSLIKDAVVTVAGKKLPFLPKTAGARTMHLCVSSRCTCAAVDV